MFRLRVFNILLTAFIILFFPTWNVFAQTDVINPVYIVQTGDTLSLIAIRFGISTQDLIDSNQITDPNAITAGTKLIIPGLEGIQGTLVTDLVPLGSSLKGFSIKYQIPIEKLTKLNRITSPFEFYAGNNMIIPQTENNNSIAAAYNLPIKKSFLELSAIEGENPWSVAQINLQKNLWSSIPGEVLYSYSKNPTDGNALISPDIKQFIIDPLPLQPGKTTLLSIKSSQPISLEGQLGEIPLQFQQTGENEYFSLLGIPINENPGIINLAIDSLATDQTKFQVSQNLLLTAGNFFEDPPLNVDPATIDPSVVNPEDQLVIQVTSQITPDKLWIGNFQYPIDDPCIRAGFGNRRVYNTTYESFHTGIDFGVCAQNLNIYADAPGKVVYTGSLVVRGNGTIIDHGQGVFSAFWHQSEILVQPGDMVEPGQIIGIIGTTGRSTGAHLHWEVRIKGVPVNPLDWIKNNYP
jgi:murein DD-endopeptidase MepM/ murein hydrolase activator NlpD